MEDKTKKAAPKNGPSPDPLKTFLKAACVALVVLCVYGSIVWARLGYTEGGQLGDMFGAANAFFSGFLLIAVVITLRMQHKALGYQRDELTETRKVFQQQVEEMQAQREVMAAQTEALNRQARSTKVQAAAMEAQAEEMARTRATHALQSRAQLMGVKADLLRAVSEVERSTNIPRADWDRHRSGHAQWPGWLEQRDLLAQIDRDLESGAVPNC